MSWHYSGEVWSKSRSWNQSILKIHDSFMKMNDAFNSALLCIFVHPKRFTIMWGGGGSLLNHHQCAASAWMMRRLPQDNSTSALTTHRLQVERRESHRANQVYALTTPQLQVERRESHRDNQVYVLPHPSNRCRGERVIEPIKCMRSPHPQLQVERVIEPIKCMPLTTQPATGWEERES